MSVKLSDRMGGLEPSATLALNAEAKRLAAEGKQIFNLTAGELASDTPEYIQHAVSNVLDRNKYTAVAGLPELRELIARHYSSLTSSISIKPENVVVSGGAKPALYASFLALIDPGDEVIVFNPAWVSYRHLIELCGGKVIEAPTDENFSIDIPGFKHLINKKTKAVIINSPNNPTGATYTKKQMEELAEIVNHYNLTVISDEIYSTLVYVDNYYLPSKTNFNNLIIINGFSKSQALTGWRIGYVIAEKSLSNAITNLLSHINGNAPLISQYAAIEAMRNGDKPPADTMKVLRKQKRLVCDKLKACSRIRIVEPNGAFYFFLDIRRLNQDSTQWCADLLSKTGVALVPGEAFGMAGYVRLTFVCDQGMLEQALDRIIKFANNSED